MEQNTQQPVVMTATLNVHEWTYIMEVLEMVPGTVIKASAINLLKPQLDAQFAELKAPTS